MKKIILILLPAIFLTAIALQTKAQRNCGTMESLQMEIAKDSTIKTKMKNLNMYVDNWVKNNPNSKSKSVITIPVVVHIVYANAAQNLSDARVLEQIAATNTDFAGLNPHSMQAFSSSLKVSNGIQICLAQRDPNGNPTTGIERVLTNHGDFNALNKDERHANTGGMDAWDVTKYYNIWVCDLGVGYCGYAQFPYAAQGGGINDTYGCSISYKYFGITGATAPFNLGGTLTHEMGHSFNLIHIWGDDSGQLSAYSCFSGTCCNGTDNCNDTPNQSVATSGAPTGVLTDACTTTSPGIMYTNFMDYSNDICYSNFTPDQVARTQALFVVGGPLYPLTYSDGCTNPIPCGTTLFSPNTTGTFQDRCVIHLVPSFSTPINGPFHAIIVP
ncbi:MAG: zinc metalloprotease [Bacteroidota bacterium]